MNISEHKGRIARISKASLRINGETYKVKEKLQPLKDFNLGDKVKVAVQDGKVVGIKKIQADEDESGEQVRSSSGGSSSPPNLSKNDRINRSLAFKTASAKIDRQSHENRQQYKDELVELSQVHLEAIEELMQE